MYKIEFTLKQHTPLIHFQHEQAGATLRASEVKPKLDKFLIDKLGGIDKARKEHPDWFISKEHEAFNYKLKLSVNRLIKEYFVFSTAENPKIQNQIKQHFPTKEFLLETQYFADNNLLKKKDGTEFGKNNKPIKAYDHQASSLENAKVAIDNGTVNLTVFVVNSLLRQQLLNSMEEFFVFNNFGCRNSKGFGCYTVEKIDNIKTTATFEEIIKRSKSGKNVYKTDINISDTKQLLKKVAKSYQVLKSGINVPFGQNPEYVKSLLFIYFCEKEKIRWEKRWIKLKADSNGKFGDFKKTKNPIDCTCSNSLQDNGAKNYKYVRSLFGVAENNEYLKSYGNDKFIVEIKNDSIERYASPLTIKVNNGLVYLFVNDTFDLIKSKSFNFKLYTKSNSTKNLEASLGVLEVPDTFDINDFLIWCNTYMNPKNIAKRDIQCQDDLQNYSFKIEKIVP